jgi:hypothetical protein
MVINVKVEADDLMPLHLGERWFLIYTIFCTSDGELDHYLGSCGSFLGLSRDAWMPLMIFLLDSELRHHPYVPFWTRRCYSLSVSRRRRPVCVLVECTFIHNNEA